MRVIRIALLVVVVLVLAVVILPVDLAYVETESMEPELGANDMFLLHESGSYGEGDIITFYSESQDDFITHRIVDETDDGYITQGDANDAVDQEHGEEPITDDMVLGQVTNIGETTLSVSGAGILAELFMEYRLQLTGLLFITLLIETVFFSGASRFERDKPRLISPLKVILYATLILMLIWTGVTFISMQTVETDTVVVDENPPIDDSDRFIELNQTEVRNESIVVGSDSLPIHVRGETVGSSSEVKSIENSGGEYIIEYEIGPYEEEGVETVDVMVYVYPQTLPSDTVTSLTEYHPIAASLATMGVLAAPFVILALAVFSGGPIRFRGLRRKLRR